MSDEGKRIQFVTESSTEIVISGGQMFQELFRIQADGTIVRGPGFTTKDEMSLEFWKCIESAFPKLS